MRALPLVASIPALLSVCAIGCGGDPALRAARNGDLVAMGHALDEQASAGKLDAAEARAVSKELLQHDLARYSGDEGVRRVGALTSCAPQLRDSLRTLAEGSDDLAAAAARLLVDSNAVAVDAFADSHRDDASPAWRAVATRGLVDGSEAALRAVRARDDDQGVRRAAIDAASECGCAGDFPLLLDAARHDPVAIVRIDAIRGLSSISDRLDGDGVRAELVDRLADLWKGGEESVRGAVARALTAPSLVEAGGRGQLESIASSDEGHAGVEAAAALMSIGGGDGEQRLAHLALIGDAGVRSHALRLLDPMRASHLETLHRAMAKPKQGGDDDALAREIAAESIASLPEERAAKLAKVDGVDVRQEAIAALRELLSRTDRIGTEAALALARLGDDSVHARLVAELATKSPMRPRIAAALLRLGHPEDLRGALADGDVDARDGVACAVLGAPR